VIGIFAALPPLCLTKRLFSAVWDLMYQITGITGSMLITRSACYLFILFNYISRYTPKNCCYVIRVHHSITADLNCVEDKSHFICGCRNLERILQQLV